MVKVIFYQKQKAIIQKYKEPLKAHLLTFLKHLQKSLFFFYEYSDFY